jgi:hypothetical protein
MQSISYLAAASPKSSPNVYPPEAKWLKRHKILQNKVDRKKIKLF